MKTRYGKHGQGKRKKHFNIDEETEKALDYIAEGMIEDNTIPSRSEVIRHAVKTAKQVVASRKAIEEAMSLDQ